VSSFIAFIDGGARNNPGPAGWGAYIVNADGVVAAELHGALGIATNNVAEYNALLGALQWALANGVTRMDVKADSLLLVEQMKGNYKVKADGLKPLNAKARLLAAQLGCVTYTHIPREQNKEADRLSNVGMDESEAGRTS
jgi:ribonuclease HI